MSASGGFTIERVRGRLDGARTAEILSFWEERGALSGDAARSRLQEVVCVLLDGAGSVIGVNSAFSDAVPLLGGRRLWVYRALLDPAAGDDAELAMIDAAHGALAEEFETGGDGSIGVCVFVSDEETMRRRPETVWPGAGMVYAGYTPDGRQVRVGYFEGARV